MKTNRLITIVISVLLLNAHSLFAQNTYVPDDNFEQALIDLGYDSGILNDSVPTVNISSVLNLDVSNKNISNLTGIKDFAALINLYCNQNQIDTLNLNDNTSLQILTCYNNQLTKLKIGNLTQLQYLHFSLNNIDSIDLRSNINLSGLSCANNNLSSLNLENNVFLTSLTCVGNFITKLDLESNTELTNLYCNENLLSSLDIRPNIKLSSLSCNNNELKSLSINNGNNHNFTLFNSEGNSDLYCIEVDNEIAGLGYSNWYKDEHTSYSEDCAVNEGEIPDAEYNCLVELYNSTLGEDWTNNTNWLDTVNSSVGDWFGITVENGHVTRIELPNNNMQEGVFENPLQLPELEVINLSGNKLMDANFYSLDSLSNLTSLHIENNNFIFKHIIDIQNLNYFNNFSDNLTYSPQGKIDSEKSVSVNEGDILEIDVAPYWLSENDQFQWYQNGTPIDGETNSFLDLSPASKSDSGTFYLEITNPLVSDLTLQSQNKEVYVNDIVISDIPISEYEALVALYHSTDGENWKYNDNWLDTTNHVINDWYGVTVEDGHVTEITLSYNKLKGEIPLEIGNLSKLTSLDLNSNNDITGSIPNEIGNLINLVNLNLKGNYLTGSLPNEIVNLSKLITLDLSFNRIQGKLPKELGNLTELRYLYLNHNTIEGPLPVELSNLKKLEVFYINANWLGKIIDGNTPREPRQIPDNLQEMSSLWTLRIGQNHLLFNDIEPIFSWSNFSNFIEFKYELQTGLHKNTELKVEPGDTIKLTIPNYVPAPSDTYSWKKDGVTLEGADDSVLILKDVQLDDEGFYYCIISNEIASGVDIFVYSTTVKVNDVHGAGVPISEYQALVEFYYSNNGVNWKKKENWLDTINVTVNEWEGIYVIDGHVKEISMDTNNISGSFPRVLYKLRELERLNFYMNNLSGSLPDDIDSLLNLRILFLSDNNFEGNIPGSLGDLDSLYLLNINNNQLSGPIPSSMGDMNKILFIELAHNNLSGTIPSSFGNLTQLRFLDLSHNQLVGPLPVELKNLENIYRFDINYNLLGEIDLNKNATSNKSADIGNNRQIPDELAGLIHMDTLHLGGNKLQFNDIEAILSWENFEEFKEFIYAPQDSIGITKTKNKFTGESATLSIDNYFPGPSDRYQWYKNGIIIQGSKSAMLNLNALQISDAGKYYCKITNPVATNLTLYSRKITVQVSEEIKGAGVPLSEYEALVAIYNNTNGQVWTNNENWLDTVSHSVSEWFGITVKENHVKGFKMPDNNLSKMPESLNMNSLTELKVIDLSNGDFEGDIPRFESLSKLDTLKLSGNKFTFKDLAEIIGWSNYDNLKANFTYSPQAKVGEEMALTFQVDDSMKIEIKFYEPEINDHFEWYKNQTIIPENDVELFTKLVTFEDNNNDFYCKISNQTLPELTLQSELIHIYVTNSMVDSFLLFDLTQAYPQLQTIWDNNVPYSTWPGVTFENGKVITLDLSGLNLEGDFSSYFNDFDSLKWLDLSNNKLSGEFPMNVAAFNSIVKSDGNSNQILKYLDISNNNFVFAELEPTFDFFQTIDTFIYAPQSMVGLPFDTTIYKNQSVTFKIANYTPGSFDSYFWSKDGTAITDTDELTFIIQNAAPGDSGYYTCSITNSLFPELTLLSDTSRLNVLIPVGIDDSNNAHFNIYPNPAEKQIFVETGNMPVNLKLFDITGTLIFGKNDFISGWINIETFSRGIYIVRITWQNSETITKKVIFK